MNKVKSVLQGIFTNFRRVTSCYPLTMVLVVMAAVTAAVFIDQSGPLGQFMENKTIPFIILWGIGTYFAETCFSEKKAPKWAAEAIAALAAFLLVSGNNADSAVTRELTGHWTSAYVIIFGSLGVWFNYRRSGLHFNEYCIRVVHELARLAIVCAITGLGIALVMATFVTLILNGKHFMLVLRAEFLVLGLLCGSGVLDAQIRTDRELPRFFILIVKYLLTVLLLAAFAIIYGYILKIIITRIVPSNEIFRILAGLFILGLPIWTMAGALEEDHILVRIAVKLPYIFIPFLFLQGYAIRERIAAYGMTPLRYLCIALMVFEVIYILVYALRKRETGIMLPVAALMGAICLVCPYVNMYDTANRSQKAIFDRFASADFESLSGDEQSSLAGAYYYLAGNEAGKAMLTDVDPLRIEAIKASGKTGDPEIDSNLYIYYDLPVRDADISAYSRLSLLSTFVYQPDREPPEFYDPENITFMDAEGNPVLNADISRFINHCISAWKENPGGTPDFPFVIELPDGDLLQVWHLSVTVGPDGEIPFLDMNAVLLSR